MSQMMVASAEYRFTIKPISMKMALGQLNEGHADIDRGKTASAAAMSTIAAERVVPARAFLVGATSDQEKNFFESTLSKYSSEMLVSSETSLSNVFRALDRECSGATPSTVLCVEVDQHARKLNGVAGSSSAVHPADVNWKDALVFTADARIHAFDAFVGRNLGRVTTDYIQDTKRDKSAFSILAGLFSAHIRRDQVGIRMAVHRFERPAAADLNAFRNAVIAAVEHLDVTPQRFVVTCENAMPEPLQTVLREQYKNAELKIRYGYSGLSNLNLMLDKDAYSNESVFINYSTDATIEAIWIPSVKS